MIVNIIYNQKIIFSKIKIATSFNDRLLGLMFKKETKGILIENCPSIHTFFMRMRIDAIFLSKKNEIVKIFRGLRPWRMTRYYFSASKVLEVEAGKFPLEITEGDKLEVVCTN